ncbi:putative porin [Hymenobacter sp. J193]|uniref:putative porin n=1 Tax=Hymenobacter sp. J193 TaxID=2898429 RepID=UPI0021519409|nr:putative porin [Hymenobacter sp. J193]MCR5889934.1 putative porin [Hymenobacter sp. J193]
MSDLFALCLQWRKSGLAARFRAALLAGLLALLLAAPARAQIIDDSTKVLYGPLTTRIVRERDVLRDQTEGTTLDTTLNTFHNQRYWLPDSSFYQDLGNLGTASRRLLWQMPNQLGARLGRNAFDRYAPNPATIPYYDTRSPFTYFRYQQSSVGEQIFELTHSRSFKKLANVGITYNRVASNKVLGSIPRNQMVRHSTITLFGRYQTEDERYHLLANYLITRHEAVEQGGIRPQAGDTALRQLFDYRLEEVWLSQAVNRDNRDDAHLTQTYRLLSRGLTAYHTLDFNRQQNRYNDDAIPYDAEGRIRYYSPATARRQTRYDSLKTEDRANYRQLDNTVGVLGHTDAVDYRLYGRYRNARLETRSLLANGTTPTTSERTFNQVFLGGTAAFRYQQFAIETAGEYKLADEYWLRASARLGPLTAEIASTSYSPTLTQQQFDGNHFQWKHLDKTEFNNTKVNQLLVRAERTFGPQRIMVEGAVVNITSLVYYNEQAVPAQLKEDRRLFIGHLRHRLVLGKLRADHDLTLTGGGNGDGLRIPAIVLNSRVAYQGYLFKKALFGQIGLETYFQSRWRPYDYSPSTQQFFVQNSFTARSYPVMDVFVSGDIKAVTFFLKLAYLNQGLYRNGYFTTPYYTGNPRSFQFGVRWNFFD